MWFITNKLIKNIRKRAQRKIIVVFKQNRMSFYNLKKIIYLKRNTLIKYFILLLKFLRKIFIFFY
jgi:hypothetical protein